MAIHKIQELALNFSLPCRKFYSVLISLCWQQGKLACDLAWPQLEIFMRTKLFLLWDIAVWSEKIEGIVFPMVFWHYVCSLSCKSRVYKEM